MAVMRAVKLDPSKMQKSKKGPLTWRYCNVVSVCHAVGSKHHLHVLNFRHVRC